MVYIVELGIDLVAWTTCTRMAKCTVSCVWTSALDHESWDYAVKFESGIEAFSGEFFEVLNVIRGFVGEKTKDDATVVGLHDHDFFASLWSCHLLILSDESGLGLF